MANAVKRFGDWELFEQLGKGASGVVYRAVRQAARLEADKGFISRVGEAFRGAKYGPGTEPFAREFVELVKEIQRASAVAPQLGALKTYVRDDEPDLEKKQQDRVAREVKAMKEFEGDPSALRLIDSSLGARPWIVTEFHPRGSLDKAPAKYTFKGDFLGALRAMRPIAALLSRIHASGFVHRDVAPKNIFLSADGALVLGDWGIVKLLHADADGFTQPGDVMGSKDYMPDWIRGREEPQSDWPKSVDVYSWGKTLWELVTGSVEPLPREHWSRPDKDLKTKFPNAPGIRYADDIFRVTVVDDETRCLEDGSLLVELVDRVLKKASGGYAPEGVVGGQACRACGEGKYVASDSSGRREFWSTLHQDGHLVQLGLEKHRYVLAAAACSACGHVEMFVWPPSGPATLEVMVKGLSDPRENIRACCAENLGRFQGWPVSAVSAAITTETNPHIRNALLNLLRNAEYNPAVLAILENVVASDTDQKVRNTAKDVVTEMRKKAPSR